MDEHLATEARKAQVIQPKSFQLEGLFSTYSALGLSHALGHKLGARYGIPHGITSVGGRLRSA